MPWFPPRLPVRASRGRVSRIRMLSEVDSAREMSYKSPDLHQTDALMSRTPADVALAAFQAVAARDPAAIVALGAPDYVDDFVAVGEFKGHASISAFFAELFAAIPDMTMSVDRIVADDSTAAVQWRATGTFSGGLFQGVRATGRRVSLRGVDVMEISDGLIQHNTIYYDGAGFARQIGMLPAAGSRADRAVIRLFNIRTRLTRR